jgi:type I restriction enzyme S subunit
LLRLQNQELQKNQSINQTNFKKYELPYFDIEQQNLWIERLKNTLVRKDLLCSQLKHQQTLLKKLRQQILQEAIEGKLTADFRAQNPDIEPAGKLLTRIKAEKEQLIKEKKNKKQKPLPPISEEEIPFELPEGWVWCRVNSLFKKVSTGPFGSMLHKSDYVPNGIPLVNPTNIKNNKIHPIGKMMIDQSTKKRLSKYALKEGEIVVARRGDLSKCAIVAAKEDGWLCGTGSFFIRPSTFIYSGYFIKLYISKFFQKQLAGVSVGQTMANLNQKILNKSLFPLPSLPEQKAIVAKVEKLLALCDQLQVQITTNQTHAEQLIQAVLKEAFSQSGEV